MVALSLRCDKRKDMNISVSKEQLYVHVSPTPQRKVGERREEVCRCGMREKKIISVFSLVYLPVEEKDTQMHSRQSMLLLNHQRLRIMNRFDSRFL